MLIKLILIFVAVASFSWQVHAQVSHQGGSIFFLTSPNVQSINARVTYLNGTPVGPEFTAQLLAGPEGTPVSSLAPVFPTTTFRDSPSTHLGYVNARDVFAGNVSAGNPATVVMLAYNGETWATSTYRGQSDPFTVFTGNATIPPGFLNGIKSFNVYAVPEPSSIAFVFLGIALFACNTKLRLTK